MLHWRYDRHQRTSIKKIKYVPISKKSKEFHTACGAYKSVPNNDCRKENYAISEITGKNTKKEKKRNR